LSQKGTDWKDLSRFARSLVAKHELVIPLDEHMGDAKVSTTANTRPCYQHFWRGVRVSSYHQTTNDIIVGDAEGMHVDRPKGRFPYWKVLRDYNIEQLAMKPSVR